MIVDDSIQPTWRLSPHHRLIEGSISSPVGLRVLLMPPVMPAVQRPKKRKGTCVQTPCKRPFVVENSSISSQIAIIAHYFMGAVALMSGLFPENV